MSVSQNGEGAGVVVGRPVWVAQGVVCRSQGGRDDVDRQVKSIGSPNPLGIESTVALQAVLSRSKLWGLAGSGRGKRPGDLRCYLKRRCRTQPGDPSGAAETTWTPLAAGAHDTRRYLRQSRVTARKARPATATMRQAGSNDAEGANGGQDSTAALSRGRWDEGGGRMVPRCRNLRSVALQVLEARRESQRREGPLDRACSGGRRRRGFARVQRQCRNLQRTRRIGCSPSSIRTQRVGAEGEGEGRVVCTSGTAVGVGVEEEVRGTRCESLYSSRQMQQGVAVPTSTSASRKLPIRTKLHEASDEA